MDVVNPNERTPADSTRYTGKNCHCSCNGGIEATYNLSYTSDIPRCYCSCAPASVNPYSEDSSFDTAFRAMET